MSNLAVQLVDRLAPRFAAQLRARRYRRELFSIFQCIVSQNGPFVLSGPFQGMKYAVPSLGDAEIYRYGGVPKLLGCYEGELHANFRKAAAVGYDTILNIGCAEGYYVAGMARLFPAARVFAFDIDSSAQKLCKETVSANAVQARVTIGGECTPAEIDRRAWGRTLVICDCEGAELQVLRPDIGTALRYCDLLVELHPHVNPSIPAEIRSRFLPTHTAELVREEARDPSAFPALAPFNAYRRRLAVSEFREGSGLWVFFSANASHA